MPTEISVHLHELDNDQQRQLDNALDHFHEVQQTLRLSQCGACALSTHGGDVDVASFFRRRVVAPLSVAVTGLPLDDNWFTHARSGRGLMTLSDWEIAFGDEQGGPPVAAPDANILLSLALVTLGVLSGLDDHELLHDKLSGCLFDMCLHKPERVIKMRSAYVCASCTAKLAERGVSALQVDAIGAVLDRVRQLVLGRDRQTTMPPRGSDETFIDGAHLPAGTSFPPRLVDACCNGILTVLVGSGMSMQSDVRVAYQAPLQWTKLPAWGDVPMRLSDCLLRYRGKEEAPRETDSLDAFLADLDFFRESLGEGLYYPRAIFDIFTPRVIDAGRANRLLFRLPLKALLTTNYDFVLQCAAPPGTPVYTWREALPAREYIAGGPEFQPILKIHGCASRSDTVVLTRVEYERLSNQAAYLSLMHSVFEHHKLLFVGFGMNDPRDLDHMLCQARQAGAAESEKFALLPQRQCGPIRDKFPQVQTIPYNDHSEIPGILAVLARETNRGN